MIRYDAIVVGGGPAGATAATLVARSGARVLLLDREAFPRYRVGESLMPATYWTLKRLGVWERLHEGDFVKKNSVQFIAENGRSSSPFYFHEFDPHESSQTWQVDRGRFDRLLLDHAAANGVEVRERANVREVCFSGSRATGVQVESPDGAREELRSNVVVDATGQAAMISRQLGLRQIDPKLRHMSFFTRYHGGSREPGIDGGATLILQSLERPHWFWYIPIDDETVSVGVVGPVDALTRGRSNDPQQVFDEELARCPAVQERLAAATRTGKVSALRDFSYISNRIAGAGWVLAGDAFGFLDPIYSTGVFLALKSGEWAADAINTAIERDDFSAEVLGSHGERYLEGMESMRKLVYAYYDDRFTFKSFLDRHPESREDVVNLLIGNVFRRPPAGLFEAMGQMIDLPPARSLSSAG